MILMIIHDNRVISKTNNKEVYEYWDDYDKWVQYNYNFRRIPAKVTPKGVFLDKKVHFDSAFARKDECVVITESNKKDYPEYFI